MYLDLNEFKSVITILQILELVSLTLRDRSSGSISLNAALYELI